MTETLRRLELAVAFFVEVILTGAVCPWSLGECLKNHRLTRDTE